jgi:hypothetical protein
MRSAGLRRIEEWMKRPGTTHDWIAAGVVVAAAALSIWRTRPPAPRPADAPPAEFSAGRAMTHVEKIALQPHPAGSRANERVREYLVETLGRLGLDPRVEEPDAFMGGKAATVRNVVAKLKGASPTGTILLVAHYDSVPTGPGAGDDGSAVAAVLEALRALRTGPPLRNDLVVLLTDGEEYGLLGARTFVRASGRLEGVRLVLNFEARGNAGPTLMFETSEGAGRLVAEYAAVAPTPGANSLMAGVYRRMPNDTDFTVFRQAGIPGLNFAFIEGYTAYHMPSDTAANLSRASLEHQGETMLAVVRRFGGLDLNDLAGEDSVYFDVLGTWVVQYPMGWTWPLTALTVLLFASGLYRGVRGGALRLGGVGVGALLQLAALAVSALIAFGISQAILRRLPVRVSHPAKGTDADVWIFATMVLAALTVSVWTLRRFAARIGTANLATGALLVWLALLVATNATMPGGTFLFLVPLLLGSVSLAAPARIGPRRWSALGFRLAPACAVLVVAPMAQRLFAAMTLERAFVAVALVSLLLGALLPVIAPLVPPRRPAP